jgi:hypothetical protein
MNSAAARIALLLAAIQQIVAPPLLFADDFNGQFAGPQLDSPSEPAGYAFAIWGVIYAGCLAFALVQLTPRWRDHPLVARIRAPATLLFLGSTVWLAFARLGPSWATVPVIWAMLALALACVLPLARAPALPRALKLAAGWPLAIYAGWLTAAAFVNSATILPAWGAGTAGLGIEGLGVAMVAGAAALGLGILALTRGALPYALAVAWALVGIIIANRAPAGSAAVLWTAAGAVALLVAGLLAIRRMRAPASA